MSIHVPTAPRPLGAASGTLALRQKAGPVGPGAGVLMTEYLLPTVLGSTAQQRMQKALKMGHDVDWIRAAERIIGAKVAGCDWHLEDPDGETIGEDYPQPLAVAAYELLEDPQGELALSGPEGVGRRQSRRQQMTLTSRHMGLAGSAVWYLDTLDGLGLPHAILYIRPDRLAEQCNDRGVLQGWLLDQKPGQPGIPLDVERTLLMQFQPPDVGIFGPGLVESSMAKAINSGLIDRHYTALLASGGRISGILAPKDGYIGDDTLYNQIVADWRNVVEQPEAARRLQIVRAPVDFTSTVQSTADMNIVELIDRNRDALLALWGVPLTLLNGQNAGSTGLNGGESRKYDEAALWQGAIHDRLVEIRETIQAGILDRWEAPLGWAPQLVFDEPEFDDDLPNFDKLQKASGTPLRNAERRAIIGLDPFGDPLLDNAIWMPVNVVSMAMGTDPDTGKVPEDAEGLTNELHEIGKPKAEAEPQGADAASLPVGPQGSGSGAAPAGPPPKGVMPPGLAASAAAAAQAAGKGTLSLHHEVADRAYANWDSILRHRGTDESMWWDMRMADHRRPALKALIQQVARDGMDAADAAHVLREWQGWLEPKPEPKPEPLQVHVHMPEQPAPIVNVSAPDVHVDGPTVNVAPPAVTVEGSQVTVEAPGRTVKRVTRDAAGRVTGTVEE